MRQPGDQVRLRRLFWEGPEPLMGDLLVTRSRRRSYMVLEVRGPVLDCVVLRPEARGDPDATIFEWMWSRRSRTAERGRGRQQKDGEQCHTGTR